MTNAPSNLLQLEWPGFDPWRIQAVAHRLSGHPLLQLAALIELGRRLERRGLVRTHSDGASAGTPFNDAPSLHPNARSAADTLGDIRDARAWMSLLNVQTDPVYRQLVDAVLDEASLHTERVDPGMHHRGGWIFISSPHAVTPFHIDKEHNFILQIHGRKRVYVWDHRDTVAVSERARGRFHRMHERDLIRWREELRERAHVFDLEPGQGAYMPSTSPHMVENGDEPSITVSFTYFTDATRREARLHAFRDWLHSGGVPPPPLGRYPRFDRAVAAGAHALVGAHRLAQRLLGRKVAPERAAYAAAHLFGGAPD
ncbi:transcription factor jumonji/aspartyl beta-hydroxylase [Mizugakiibacter sediminis]|uniref:Transcription factor jumonji/aspartyl beta-hydroxylase n=1 Tax=Mizugakiibacter sediminis TaxID=1475481 RepID=A0A0K8QPL3_9GAMM|nr:cupin-like domain-containing protein [Mizugakiibacter sediminis]GAP66352.1 transcription factor jumonji/aspartyl beta-hydroxylase [Mizugakiibacter sediminis]